MMRIFSHVKGMSHMAIRNNQRARTLAALTRAAGELLREGQPPSMPAAAERALVSLATAYRYFSSAEELWDAAASFDVEHLIDSDGVRGEIEAAGDDVEARLEILIRRLGWTLIDHDVLMRQAAKTSLERWFAQQGREGQPKPLRPRQRNQWNRLALAPLRDRMEDHQVDALVEALGCVWGAEPIITLLDVLELSPDAAKERMMTTARWVVRGGLADLAG